MDKTELIDQIASGGLLYKRTNEDWKLHILHNVVNVPENTVKEALDDNLIDIIKMALLKTQITQNKTLFDLEALSEEKRLKSIEALELIQESFDEKIDQMTKLAATILNCPAAMVSIVMPDKQFFKSYFGISEHLAQVRETPLKDAFCRYVATSGETFVVTDSREHELVKESELVLTEPVIAYLGCPIQIEPNQTLGAFCVIDKKPRQWSQAEILQLKELTNILVLYFQTRMMEIALNLKI